VNNFDVIGREKAAAEEKENEKRTSPRNAMLKEATCRRLSLPAPSK